MKCNIEGKRHNLRLRLCKIALVNLVFVMTDESSILGEGEEIYPRVDSHVTALFCVKQTNEFHCAAALI